MPEMQSRRNDKVVLRSTTTRKTTTTTTIRRWIRRRRREATENEKRGVVVCFEFNSPRRGINSLEGKPFGARSVTRLGWNVLGVFITLMERECRRWCPGRGGWRRREEGVERRKRRLRRMLWNRQERIITLAAKQWNGGGRREVLIVERSDIRQQLRAVAFPWNSWRDLIRHLLAPPPDASGDNVSDRWNETAPPRITFEGGYYTCKCLLVWSTVNFGTTW